MNDRLRVILASAAGSAAVTSAVFVLLVAGMMLWNHTRLGTEKLLESETLAPLKQEALKNPEDESLCKRVREIDLVMRREYFHAMSFSDKGAKMLGVALGVVLLSLCAASGLRQASPQLGQSVLADDEIRRATRLGRFSAGGLCAALASGALVWALTAAPAVDLRSLDDKQSVKTVAAAPRAPLAEEIARNWPRFRGLGGGGFWPGKNVPVAWDAPADKGILWKTPIPLKGKNSPIVWGKRIFLTGATAKRREVYCFDADTGKMLWSKRVSVIGTQVGVPNVLKDTGFAAPTCATDGRWVVAMFANGDIACFDVTGNQLWAKNLGLPENIYGHATSLDIRRDNVIVQFDQAQAEDEVSELLALDCATGKEAWSVPREVPNSWSSPIIIRSGDRDMIVTTADPWTIAYDADSGDELWRVDGLSGDIGPSPIYAGGKIFVVNTNAVLAAIAPDGEEDVTETHVAWTVEDGLPDICSPVSDGELVWLLTSSGELTCYDAKNGEMVYEHDLDTNFTASPSLAGGRLYMLTQKGVAHVASTGRKYEQIHLSPLGEGVYASPAFGDGRIYIRGKDNLYCIGEE